MKMNKIVVKSDYIATDITSIKIIKDKVLAGIGNFLHVFDLRSGTCEIRRELFEGQKIHGFHHHEDQIVIYGGRYFTVLPIFSLGNAPIQKYNASDWILTVQWLADGKLALALAHNVIALWDCSTKTLISETVCEEKCILYSALLLGSTWSDLIVFAGTVFTEIVVWSPSVSCETEDKPVWHRVKGHKGVIFSISYASDVRCLLSCSDDRSVRVWKVSDPTDWRTADIKECLAVYGHPARVWRVIPSSKGFISIGEDSFLCQWNYEGQVVSKINAHQGASIWSVDINEDIVVTGGGDGCITTWPLGPAPPTLSLPSLPWQGDGVRRVRLTAQSRVLVTTEHGRLCSIKQDGAWEQAWQNDGYKCYALLELSPCRTKVALASLHGDITVLQETCEGLTEVATCQVSKMKILSLIWLNEDLILTSSVGDARTLCTLSSHSLEVKSTFQGTSKNKAISAATLMSEHLVLGDQHGSLFVHQHNKQMTLVHKLPRQIGVDGVMSLQCCGSQLAATGKDGRLHWFKLDSSGHLLPLSCQLTRLGWLFALRESQFGTLALAVHREIFTVWSLAQQRMLLQVDCGGGHRSWDFAIQNGRMEFTFVREKGVFLVSSEIGNLVKPQIRGGLHSRVINCLLTLPGADASQLLVSAGDEGSVRIWSAQCGTQRAVLHAHLSSVRALCCHLHNGNVYLFSAGGRAQMVVWRLSNLSADICIEELENHMLCEQQLCKTPWTDTHFRPRPNPETRYMSLCVLHADNKGICVLAACSDTLLRTFYLDFTTNSISVALTINFHSCCILRVVCCSELAVSASCDGVLALWNVTALLESSSNQNHAQHNSDIDTNSEKCNVVENTEDDTSLLEGNNVKSSLENKKRQTEISLKPLWSGRVHQSGINCLALYQTALTTFILISGGDDNKLAVSNVDTRDHVSLTTTWSTDQAHVTEITGVFMLSSNMFISTSIDQRVILWHNKAEDSSWQQVGMVVTTVADIQGLAVWNLISGSCKVCVYGKGSEILSLTW